MGVMNELIDPPAIATLVGVLKESAPGVPWERTAATGAELGELNLRARTDLVARALVADISDATRGAGYTTAARSFRAALQFPEFTGWVLWPVSEAAVSLALDSGALEDFDDCLGLLAELTPRLTGEFAIRRLLARDPDRALAAIQEWIASPDEHVRRLASEGTRPYLPWAVRVPALVQRPEATLPILDALYRDSSEYVQRSVANHLNDLARHAPGAVVATAGRWLAAADSNTADSNTVDKNTAWVVRHGLRTLIKKGHPGALALLGFTPASVMVNGPRLDRETLTVPGELTFAFEISNSGAEEVKLAVDYKVHYQKANGRQSAKVFKISTLTLAPGERRSLSKRHAFRQMTTRVHHPGLHALELQINGAAHGRAEFLLETV
ncbi:3-methyladenine DNA glycosylase AlkC [Pseudarthrobacter sp. W1I19]|uniref:DNA alkylation repair protein n=1 Tax=Pseudarthrobacter sp. W1I19 TaxID=3042288 RepID=UPI002786A779|nr:DNA alkylation repair protein [Pseudarthrobacter sp. W1I19]MDQ0921998.1 3-methyladenine DNA glycosylase AlkC [Pseudarthrobacter sp. W1I19]